MKRMLGLALFALAVPVAHGQAACPANMAVDTMPAGFSCTMGDKTFSNFSLTGVPSSALLQFGQLGPLFAVTLSRDGIFFPMGTTIFDYTVTASGGMHILEGTVGVDVSFPPEVTATTMNGQLLTIANGGTGEIMFNPGASSVDVTNVSHILTATTELNSVSNDFSQVVISVFEPGTLGMLAAGLGGLALFRRRR